MVERVKPHEFWMTSSTLIGLSLILLTAPGCSSDMSMPGGVTGQDAEVKKPLIVAHRGASRAAPENTIPAFNLAWERGADAIEGDFRMTSDGHIVCIHDKNTDRVAASNLVVARSSLEDLRTLDVGSHRGAEYQGAVIPTIGEVFATVPPGKKIYIEIKTGASIIPPLLEEIRNSDLDQEQIFVISFNKEVIRRFEEEAPQYETAWLSGFKKDKTGTTKPTPATVLETLEEINADGFSSNKNLIDASFVKQIMAQSYQYHVWTVDDPETALRFKKWGADSITTNVPGRIRAALFDL